MELKIIDYNIVDPAVNLDIENSIYKLVSNNKAILRFWRNLPSVFIGRFQKADYEVNGELLASNEVPILRRMSGGGTVYHDLGTLNVSYLEVKKSKNQSASIITSLLKDALAKIGYEFDSDERSSLYHNGKKFLGSAVRIHDNIFHYHASILVNTDLSSLMSAINWTPNYQSGDLVVHSKRSPVINLSTIDSRYSVENIKSLVISHLEHALDFDNETRGEEYARTI